MSNELKISELRYLDISSHSAHKLNDDYSSPFLQNFNSSFDFNAKRNLHQAYDHFNTHILGIEILKTNVLFGMIHVDFNFIEYTIECEFLVFEDEFNTKYLDISLSMLLEYFRNNFPNFLLTFISSSESSIIACLRLRKDLKLRGEFIKNRNKFVNFGLRIPNQQSSLKPKIPDFLSTEISICVAANDAGGAQQVSNIMEFLNRPFSAFLDGPAIEIFEKSRNNYTLVKNESDIDKFDLLICGTGWMSNLEFNMINHFKKNRKPSLAVLDHWVNYQSRFERGFRVEPNMLAVTNLFALDLAKKYFPRIPVWLIPDFELAELRKLIIKSTDRKKILVLLEPYTVLQDSFSIDQSKVIELIEKACKINKIEKLDGVIVRAHPSSKFQDSDLRIFKAICNNVSISSNLKLKEDLQNSAKVLGFSSYGLYLSSMSDIDTYSYFANYTGHWTNQFPSIKSL
jgi:hypothetical protein